MTQRDLPADTQSGLEVAIKVLKDIDDIAMVNLNSLDIVRHPLVQKIVNAYDAYEAKLEKAKRPSDFRPPSGGRDAGKGTGRSASRRDERHAGRPPHSAGREKYS